jgi:hypothetical protein
MTIPADDIAAKIFRHLKAIENEMNHLWSLQGMREPLRPDTGAVSSTRSDADNRRIFSH